MAILYAIIAIICGIGCYTTARSKNRNALGWFFGGLLLSFLGLLIIVLLPMRGKRCPQCMEIVQPDARICRYCNHQFA